MKSCLVCQTDSDRVELFRIPVRIEDVHQGDMLVCRSCVETLGVEEAKQLVAVAVREQGYEESNFLSAT
jgi:hypothetical protein